MSLLNKIGSAMTVGVTGPLGIANTIGGTTGNEMKSLIPGIGDAMAQTEANKANLRESALNRRFQENMSNTAYQRAMADMKKAGLNPTLAFMQGGASSPSGSTATVQSASKTRLADMALKATTGIGALSQQATGLEQQKTMNESSIKLNASAAAKNVADAEKTRVDTKGLGKKAAEGDLWDKFYKGINNMLDSSAKDAQKSNRTEPPLIKKLGTQPHSKGISDWLFQNKKGKN